MDSIDDLYCRNIQYLQNIGLGNPVHGMGNIASLKALKSSSRVIALMLITEEKGKIPPNEIKEGKAILVREAIEKRPDSLADAVMSWVLFGYEEHPSTLLIHSGVDLIEVKLLCYTRLFREVTKSGLNDQTIKKTKELANGATLTEPESVREVLAKI